MPMQNHIACAFFVWIRLIEAKTGQTLYWNVNIRTTAKNGCLSPKVREYLTTKYIYVLVAQV